MPTYLLTCESCGGHRPFFFEEEAFDKLRAQESVIINCPVCHTTTRWKLGVADRRTGEDRRVGDRRGLTESWYVQLCQDGSTAADVDKRVYPRYQSPPDSYVVYLEGSGGMRDLSLGGIFVPDRNPLRVGTFVSLELRVGEHSIPVRGMVRRSVPGEGMGIEFLEMSAEGKRRLKLFLASLAAPSRAKPSS